MTRSQRRNENASKVAPSEAINLNPTKEKIMSNNTTLVPFYGSNLITVKVGEVVYVAMRPIVEVMGIDWSGQTAKFRLNKDKFNCGDISTVGADGRSREMLCIPLRKLNGWLFSINPAKVKESIRDTVIKYQEECFEVLHDYWTKGEAINPRLRKEKTRKALPNGLTIDQQDTIKAFHKELVNKVPKNKQASMAITLWSSIKSKYGVSYKEVPPEEFTAVVSLMSRVAVEKGVLHGEVLDDDFQHHLFDEAREGAYKIDYVPFPYQYVEKSMGGNYGTVDHIHAYHMMETGTAPIRCLLQSLNKQGFDTDSLYTEYGMLQSMVKNLRRTVRAIASNLDYLPETVVSFPR